MEDTQAKVILDKLDTQGKRQDEMRGQLDLDRSSIDQNTIDIDSIKKGQEVLLKQMTDFKAEIRQQIQEAIKEEVPRAVRKAIRIELNTISLKNPKKAFERQVGFGESLVTGIKKLLKLQ